MQNRNTYALFYIYINNTEHDQGLDGHVPLFTAVIVIFNGLFIENFQKRSRSFAKTIVAHGTLVIFEGVIPRFLELI